jgi:hypothetical protein
MTYILAFMMCLPGDPSTAECRWSSFDLPDLRACAAMKRLVIQEARDEGFKVHAVCAPIAQQTSGADASPNFPR